MSANYFPTLNQCTLPWYKSTECKQVWREQVDDISFSLYVPDWRIPDPLPESIAVTFFPIDDLPLNRQLYPFELFSLEKRGWSDAAIEQLKRMLPLRIEEPRWTKAPIVVPVQVGSIYTNTVRYDPIEPKNPAYDQVGTPYIPMTLLPLPYPNVLIIKVDWLF